MEKTVGKSIARIIELALSGALVFIFHSCLRTDLAWLPQLLYIISAFFFLAAVSKAERLQIYLLLIAVGVLPLFGCGALGMVLSAFVGGRAVSKIYAAQKSAEHDAVYLGLLILFLLNLSAALHTMIIKTDWLLVDSFLLQNAFTNLLVFLKQHQFFQATALQMVAEWLLLLLIYHDLSSRKDKLEEAAPGALLVVALFSTFWALAQLLKLFPSAFINSSAFWIYAERVSGSFSDPNAFGLAALLLIPLLFEIGIRRRGLGQVLFLLGASLLLVTSLFSGSRTELLGLALVSALLLFARANLRQRIIVSAVGLIAVALIFNPRVNQQLQTKIPLPAAVRVLQTFHPDHVKGMLWSRQVYSRLAWEVFLHAPGTGVGLGRFYEMQESTAKNLNIDLKDWRDNANNFYLQILAEAGVCGLALVLLAFLFLVKGLKVRNYETPCALLLSFPLILLTGPHTNFLEIKILLAVLFLLLSRHAVRQAWILPAATFCSALIVFSAVIAAPLDANRGVYGLEHGAEGDYFWTGQKAELAICENTPALRFNLSHPDLQTQPVKITFQSDNEIREVTTNRSGWQEFKFKNPQHPSGKLKIEVSRTWSPRTAGLNPDPRMLGIMLAPTNLCNDGAHG